MIHFNQLTPAEAERLALLAEECAEVIHIVGKILRHSYESTNPDGEFTTTNRELLENELGHVDCAKGMLIATEDVSEKAIKGASEDKFIKVGRYLHHQKWRDSTPERKDVE